MFNKKKNKKTALGRVGRVEREQRYRQITQISTITVVGLVVLVTIFGFVYNKIIVPGQPIVTINGEEILTRDFQRRVKLQRDQLIQEYSLYYQIALSISDTTQQQQYLSYLSQIEAELEQETIGNTIMNQMIDEKFIVKEAESRGITVSDQEVNDYYYGLFGYYPDGAPTSTPTTEMLPTSTLSATQLALITPTPEVTPTATDEVTTDEATPTEETAAEEVTPTEIPLPTSVSLDDFNTSNETYLEGLKNYDVDEAFMKDLVRVTLYRDKLMAEIKKGISPEEEQVWARHILVEDEETALQILDELNNGGDFGDLAIKYSTGSSASAGGNLGWFGRGTMVQEFEDAAFSGEVGDIVGPVQTTYGFHIIQILGKEMRQVDDTTLASMVNAALTDILDQDIANADIVYANNWINRTPTDPSIYDILGTN
ncbi:peptidylprolyl isomerase [bacterium]|nr:peptidylprolyl isomerase [bacterium]